jgi:prepilin-type N-terminal cleavage/methylation domain-containing protein
MTLYTSSHKGFTLLELLVSMAIIGLLASVILGNLSSAREKARDAQRVSDLNEIRYAAELYFREHGEWPCTGMGTTDDDLYIEDQTHCLVAELVPAYLPQIPTDPLYGGDGLKQSGNDYQYYVNSVGYRLRTAFEGIPFDQDSGYPDGTTCQVAGLPVCPWQTEDCVYMTGGGCEVMWLHLGG